MPEFHVWAVYVKLGFVISVFPPVFPQPVDIQFSLNTSTCLIKTASWLTSTSNIMLITMLHQPSHSLLNSIYFVCFFSLWFNVTFNDISAIWLQDCLADTKFRPAVFLSPMLLASRVLLRDEPTLKIGPDANRCLQSPYHQGTPTYGLPQLGFQPVAFQLL